MKQRVNAFEPDSQGQCKKHPISSPVGVCAYCLNDRLLELQRFNLSSYCDSPEFDSVGNSSISDEHEKHLSASNISCVEAKKGNGLWRIKDFFGKMIENRWGEKSNFGLSEDQSGVSSSSRYYSSFSTAKISDSDNFYGSNRMELSAIYENYYCVPKRSDFEVEESDFSKLDY
ncbi:hypothetical protein CASFOL_009796 [Castilleja foliolosa]|uniref:Uncharacterized protein n=1 Tax=Castilleja foliolosa TaxID=1961234 RepID=A0ABD3DQQ5_9LAMI